MPVVRVIEVMRTQLHGFDVVNDVGELIAGRTQRVASEVRLACLLPFVRPVAYVLPVLSFVLYLGLEPR